jgi:hypothetical protein
VTSEIRLYRLEQTMWKDPWGRRHPSQKIVERIWAVEAGRFPVNNGYEVNQCRVAVSDSGHTFVKHVPIDFGGQSNWHEPVDHTWWYERLPLGTVDEHDIPI